MPPIFCAGPAPNLPFRSMAERHDVETWMWLRASELAGRAERMQRHFFRLAAVVEESAAWEPPVDVFEAEHEVVVVVAMPGVSAERLQVGLDGDALVVRGRRPVPPMPPTMRVRRLEIPHGTFARRIELPPGPFEVARVHLGDGCLTATLLRR